MIGSLTIAATDRARIVSVLGSAGSLWAILLALAAGSILIAAAGANPIQAYMRVLEGAFGGIHQISVTVRLFIPICLAALAVAVPLRCGLFNIGAEGQLILGAVAATAVALFVTAPVCIHIPLALFAAGLAGAAWSALAGALLAYRRVNEVLSTVMLNFLAGFVAQYLVRSPWRSSDAMFPATADFPDTARFATFGRTYAWHTGVFVTLAALVVAYVLLSRSRFGFSMRILSSGPDVARNIGLPIPRTIVAAMGCGGVFAGLAGATEVMGVQHNLTPQFSPGFGFDAVMIAMLAGGSPLRICIVAFLFAALRNGVGFMQRVEGVPSAVGQVAVALIVIFLAVDAANRIHRSGRRS